MRLEEIGSGVAEESKALRRFEACFGRCRDEGVEDIGKRASDALLIGQEARIRSS
jgi:hypothetical protein